MWMCDGPYVTFSYTYIHSQNPSKIKSYFIWEASFLTNSTKTEHFYTCSFVYEKWWPRCDILWMKLPVWNTHYSAGILGMNVCVWKCHAWSIASMRVFSHSFSQSINIWCVVQHNSTGLHNTLNRSSRNIQRILKVGHDSLLGKKSQKFLIAFHTSKWLFSHSFFGLNNSDTIPGNDFTQ